MAKNAKNCEDCYYSWRYHSGTAPLCEYILITGQRRPCPAGKGCKVKINGARDKNLIFGKQRKEADPLTPKRGAPRKPRGPYKPRQTADPETLLRNNKGYVVWYEGAYYIGPLSKIAEDSGLSYNTLRKWNEKRLKGHCIPDKISIWSAKEWNDGFYDFGDRPRTQGRCSGAEKPHDSLHSPVQPTGDKECP